MGSLDAVVLHTKNANTLNMSNTPTSKIEFQGYEIKPQYLRSDDSVRITINISQDQIENVQDILLRRLPNGMFKITIEPIIEELGRG